MAVLYRKPHYNKGRYDEVVVYIEYSSLLLLTNKYMYLESAKGEECIPPGQGLPLYPRQEDLNSFKPGVPFMGHRQTE